MKICIVGGGVSGIQTALYLFEKGHECHMYESRDKLGGVWVENYDGYSLQVPSQLYEFRSMKLEYLDGTFPSGQKVQEMIQTFINMKELQKKCHIHLNEKIVKIYKSENKAWSVDSSLEENKSFDYCVICTGMYNNPYIPQNLKHINPIHSSEFLDSSIAKEKKGAVIGGGKSAIDCAVAAANHAKSVTLISREIHWPVPRYILNMIPFQWGTYSRLGHFLIPNHHWNISSNEKKWHRIFLPFKNAIWKLLEHVFSFQFNIKVKPTKPLDIDLFNCGQILTYELRDAVEKQKIDCIFIKDSNSIASFAENFDIVICGTGFKKDYTIFEKDIKDQLDIQDDGLWLYKNIIPIGINNLAFIGSEVSTFNNILTQSLQAQWLAHIIEEKSLPDSETMCQYVQNERNWKRSWMDNTSSRASLIQLHMTKYHDELCVDIKKSLPFTRWWQWIFPLTSRDY